MGDFGIRSETSPPGKLEPLDVVSESLEGDAPLTDAQRTELDYRMARYEQNSDRCIRWNR